MDWIELHKNDLGFADVIIWAGFLAAFVVFAVIMSIVTYIDNKRK